MGKKSKDRSTANTSESTNDSNIKPVVKRVFIKNAETGYLYELLTHKKDPNFCFLRSGNSYQKFKTATINQGIVFGNWIDPNEHEIRSFIKKEDQYMLELRCKLVNRVLFAQLLLEIDDELKKDFHDDKYFRGILERSEKQCTRIINENMTKMYGANAEVLFTFLESIQRVGKKLSSRLPHEFMYFEKAIDMCIENPEAFTPDAVEIMKLDTKKD